MAELSLRLKRNLILSSCLVAASACVAPLAHAATATADAADASQASVVQQITVTAERRSIDIQRAPVAVSSVQAKQLDESFVTTVSGLNATIPSLEITKASGFENLVAIRGIGSETPENSLTTVPGVSEFVDGVYIANSISLDETLFDINNIQVLRGPQGALYGQSSIGGAIIIETNQPQLNRLGASGDVSFGTYNLFRERAEANVPVGDDIAMRFSVQKFDHDGFTNDVAIPGFQLDTAHDVSGKMAVLWKPSDHFSATLTGQWYNADQSGDAQKNINDPNPDPRVVSQDYPGKFQLTTQLYHLNLEWDLPWATLKSVTAYQDLQHVQQEDGSRSTFALLGAYDNIAAWNTWLNNVTEEFDILSPAGSRLNWTVGAFALTERSTQFVVEFECPTSVTPCPGPATPADLIIPPDVTTNPPGNLGYGNLSHVQRTSYSLFGQATYPITDKFRITGGIRGNWDSYRDVSHNFFYFGVSPVVDNAQSDFVPTWRAEADYDVTPDNMVYFSVSRGYKPGGVNGSYGQVLIPPVFKPETNTAYEIGSKNLFLDKSLRFNLAAFYYQHKNFQYIETDPVPFDGGIANIPSIHDYGVEMEGSYVGMDGHLHLNGSLALEKGTVDGDFFTIDSTVQNQIIATSPNCAFGGAFYNPACWADELAGARNINGKQPPDMPNVSGSFSASYNFDFSNGVLTPRIEYIYRGSEWARIFNEPGLDKVKSYNVVNLNLAYVPANSPLKFSVTATNLFDEAGVNSRYIDPYGTGQTSDQFIPPRQIIGTIAFSF